MSRMLGPAKIHKNNYRQKYIHMYSCWMDTGMKSMYIYLCTLHACNQVVRNTPLCNAWQRVNWPCCTCMRHTPACACVLVRVGTFLYNGFRVVHESSGTDRIEALRRRRRGTGRNAGKQWASNTSSRWAHCRGLDH